MTACGHCGAALSAADLELDDCRYCGRVLPHRAKAAESAAKVEALLADKDGDGIPDVVQGLMGPKGPAVTTTVETFTFHPQDAGSALRLEQIFGARVGGAAIDFDRLRDELAAQAVHTKPATKTYPLWPVILFAAVIAIVIAAAAYVAHGR